MGLNRILDIGMSGLYSASAAMQTASHNISNVETEGFSRQGVTTGTRLPLHQAYGLLGGGSDVTAIRRLTDGFLIDRVRGQSTTLARYEQNDLALQDIEMLLGPADGNPMGTALDRFFASWSELSTGPITEELRSAVLDQGQVLARQISTTAHGLDDLALQMEERMELGVSVLNDLLSGVADLNQQILLAEGPGENANDLRDRRDVLLQEIAALGEVDAVTRGDGTIDVIMAGRTVVVRGEATSLEISHDEDGRAQITAGNRAYPLELQGGELGGLMEAVQDQVVRVREQLDAFTAELIERVNELHVQGRTAGGSGLMFFTGTDAETLEVNHQLIDRPDMVATSRTGLAGDSDIAREIAALGEDQPADSTLKGLAQLYGTLITDVAASSAASRMQLESQQQAVDALTTRLESVRGVSLDEEAANMARYQNAYAASAKVVAAAQDMFDTILNIF